MSESFNPTQAIPLNYHQFVKSRESQVNQHMVNGVPDYAFSLDYTIRQQLDKIPLLRRAVEGLLSYRVPLRKIQYEEKGIVVGPNQFAHIHGMAVDCANRLGIPIPDLYILPIRQPNAFTMATGHTDQLIVLTSGLLESVNDAELKNVIGHECGHIHNRHIVYNTLWELLTNQVARGFFIRTLSKFAPAWVFDLAHAAFTASTAYIFGRWHRCAEITCDRAGLICGGNVEAAMSVPARLRLAGAGDLKGFNADTYKKQMKNWNRSFFRLEELFMTHPPGPQRAYAVEKFAATDIYHSWHPEIVPSQPLVELSEVDEEISTLFT